MKNIYSTVAILILALLSINFVSAVVLSGSQVEIILKPESGIKMDVLESFCSEDSCQIENEENIKTIYFKLDSQESNFIIIAMEDKNKDLFSLHIVEGKVNSKVNSFASSVSAGLALFIDNDVIYGLSEQDIEEIKSSIGEGYLIYYKFPECGNSFFNTISDAFSDDGKLGWIVSDSYDCKFDKYENSCPRIDCSDTYVPGELIVSFDAEKTSKENAIKKIEELGLEVKKDIGLTISVTFSILVPEGEEKQWISTLESEDIVDFAEFNGITDTATLADTYIPGELIVSFYAEKTSKENAIKKIEELGLEVKKDIGLTISITFSVLVPEGEEERWISALENEDIVDFAEFNGLTYVVPISFEEKSNLKNENRVISNQEDHKEKNNLVYWIMGIILVIIVVLFLVFRKNYIR